MIVDDNPDFVRAARLLLEREGLRVVGVASTGADAVSLLTELRPDVTLIDIDLGGESGFELARRLVSSAGLDPRRLILISGHDECDFADLIEESPAVGFVAKSALSARAIETLLHSAGYGCDDQPSEPGGR